MRVGKVLVVGAAEAGKSTLIQALAPGAMNLAVKGRTVAMDHAVVSRGERAMSLVGVPGQDRFGPIREVLAVGTRCAVWVHRAGDEMDDSTAGLVGELTSRGVPYVVYVNHHRGSSGDDGWRVPAGCSEPVAVVNGDLLAPGGSLVFLQDEIWRLVS